MNAVLKVYNVSHMYQDHFHSTINRSIPKKKKKVPDQGPLLWLSPFGRVFSSAHNPLAVGHTASDLHPEREDCDWLWKHA